MSAPFEWREAPDAEFAVIGDPIVHSLSPKMHRAALAELGLSYRYVALRVPQEEVPDALDHLALRGYRGINVTVPLKAVAFQWVREADSFSTRVGAVNTIELAGRRGINTDGAGFLETLQAFPKLEPSANVLVLGAGGSARSICLALYESGYGVKLWNRTQSRAEALISQLGLPADTLHEGAWPEADLIVNSTSAGLGPQGLDVEWQAFRRRPIAYDLSYGSALSPFLEEARGIGLQTTDGRPLLAAQGALSLEWWLGREAPRTAMLQAIR